MQSNIEKASYARERFFADIRLTAGLVGAAFSAEKTQQALTVFDEEWRTCVIQFKTTSAQRPELYYRFWHKGDKDLMRTAQRAGMLPGGDGPLFALSDEVAAAFARGPRRTGCDFDSERGLTKVWTIIGRPVPTDEICKLLSMPTSVRDHRGFFAEHGLGLAFFVASDFEKQSMNLYFRWEPQYRSPQWIRRLAAATGSGDVSDTVVADILDSLPVAACLGFTFDWKRPEILRWCIYSLDVPFHLGAASPCPLPALPERLARFGALAPTLHCAPQFNPAWSFGRAGAYLKLEKSYAKDANHFLVHEYGCDISRPAAVGKTGS
jgi:hypothetical protein